MEEYTDRILPVAFLLLAAEIAFPKSRYTYVSRLRGAIFCVTNILITKASLTLFHWFWAGIGIKPLFAIDLTFLSKFSNAWPLHLLGAIAASFLVLQVSEFFYYWFHRLQHSNSFFWRFHAEHHSLEIRLADNALIHVGKDCRRVKNCRQRQQPAPGAEPGQRNCPLQRDVHGSASHSIGRAAKVATVLITRSP